jgi:2-oxoisovalerate dehydrogenase E1 component beta subunit
MVPESLEAAEAAARAGISCEVLDLRTLWPVDITTLETSARKTGRVVVVHEAARTCGFGAEVAALLQERCFVHLEAPVKRVTGWDTPFPYALEQDYLPLAPRILAGVDETFRFVA